MGGMTRPVIKGLDYRFGMLREVEEKLQRFDVLSCGHLLPAEDKPWHKRSTRRFCKPCGEILMFPAPTKYRAYHLADLGGQVYHVTPDGWVPKSVGSFQANEWAVVWASSKQEAVEMFKRGEVQVRWTATKRWATADSAPRSGSKEPEPMPWSGPKLVG